jgi:hypothetical protein
MAGTLTVTFGWINAWMNLIVGTAVLFVSHQAFFVLLSAGNGTPVIYSYVLCSTFVQVFVNEMDAKVGDCVYGTQCSTSTSRNMAGHRLTKIKRHPSIFQPWKGHRQGVYLIHSRSKFNKMSKIQRSVFRLSCTAPATLLMLEGTSLVLLIFVLNSCLNWNFNPLETNGRLLYLKAQSVPRCKHFSSLL